MQKLSKEEFMTKYNNDLIHKERLKEREVKAYKIYWRINYKKLMRSYFSSKAKDRNKVIYGY